MGVSDCRVLKVLCTGMRHSVSLGEVLLALCCGIDRTSSAASDQRMLATAVLGQQDGHRGGDLSSSSG